MPMIQSKGVTVRFINRSGVAEAMKKFTNPDGSSKDPMNVPGKLMELHQTLSAMGASKTVTEANDMFFDLKKDEIKMAPEWVIYDWGYSAHRVSAEKGGPGIIEILPQSASDLRSSAAMIPKGSPPPPEAFEFNKTQVTAAAALESVNDSPAGKRGKKD